MTDVPANAAPIVDHPEIPALPALPPPTPRPEATWDEQQAAATPPQTTEHTGALAEWLAASQDPPADPTASPAAP